MPTGPHGFLRQPPDLPSGAAPPKHLHLLRSHGHTRGYIHDDDQFLWPAVQPHEIAHSPDRLSRVGLALPGVFIPPDQQTPVKHGVVPRSPLAGQHRCFTGTSSHACHRYTGHAPLVLPGLGLFRREGPQLIKERGLHILSGGGCGRFGRCRSRRANRFITTHPTRKISACMTPKHRQ